jgi:hypothetical protein
MQLGGYREYLRDSNPEVLQIAFKRYCIARFCNMIRYKELKNL